MVLTLMSVLVLGIMGSSELKAQGWEKYFGGAAEDEVTAVVQTISEGYTIVGITESLGSDNDTDIYLARVDVDGSLVWQKAVDEGFIERGYDLIYTADGGFLIVGYAQLDAQINNNDAYLVKVNNQGEIQWSKTFGDEGDDFFQAITATSDGNYILAGRTNSYSGDGTEQAYLVKVDTEGNEIWSETYGGAFNDRANDVVSAADGSVFLLGNTGTSADTTNIFLLKTDANGVEEWSETFGGTDYNEGLALILDSENNLVFTGHQDLELTILKTDYEGALIWSKVLLPGEESIGNDLIETFDQQYALTGISQVTPADAEIVLAKIDKTSGDPMWLTYHGRNFHFDWGASLVQTKDNGFIVGGFNSQFTALFNDVTLLKTNGAGDIYTTYVEGYVFFDDGDCEYDGEMGLDDWLIEVVGDNKTYYGSTDENGYYSILVDTGEYDMNLLVQSPYWEGCVESYNGVVLNEIYDTTNFDFPTHGLIDCPLLNVQISTPYVIPCYDLTYTVYYSNQGPVEATDVEVSLTLDEELAYVSSTIAPDQQIGDSLFVFNFASLQPGETGTFELVATASCDTETGQAVSAQAAIQPDSICTEINPDWDGASLTVGGSCDTDSVRFQIRNIGQDMEMTTNYIVIEDEVMAIASPIDLPGGDSLDISVPSNGATFRIIAEQTLGHPGNSYPTVVVEGCTEDGSAEFSVGQVLQFPEDEGNSFISIDVQEALDPLATAAVSLRGYPKGYLDEKLITSGTELEYQVFFQNTGQDTVYRVVVRDTLSNHLDLTSIQAGASSHSYDFVVYEEGYVKFIFDDIILPPLSVDPENSFGAFTFKVSQKEGNPNGTLIENRVSTYMGFDEPTLSNTVQHVVGGEQVIDFITVSIDKLPIQGTSIMVYPNPFSESALLEVEGIELNAFELTIYDQMGRKIREIKGFGNNIEIRRNDLPTGTYFIRLEAEGRLIGTGKIVVQ
ncbi:MAG: DUF11 domain-containing protein [Bacteroidetes bacterium]|nr:DUF11 domain-containing protein [Bacteroidota bacterium]